MVIDNSLWYKDVVLLTRGDIEDDEGIPKWSTCIAVDGFDTVYFPIGYFTDDIEEMYEVAQESKIPTLYLYEMVYLPIPYIKELIGEDLLAEEVDMLKNVEIQGIKGAYQVRKEDKQYH